MGDAVFVGTVACTSGALELVGGVTAVCDDGDSMTREVGRGMYVGGDLFSSAAASFNDATVAGTMLIPGGLISMGSLMLMGGGLMLVDGGLMVMDGGLMAIGGCLMLMGRGTM